MELMNVRYTASGALLVADAPERSAIPTNAREKLPRDIAGGLIRPDMSRREVRATLSKNGWKYLSGGSFSSVWETEGGDTVIKIAKPDAGAEAICEAHALQPSNPYFPRYHGRLPLGDGGVVYEVERLDRLDLDAFDRLKNVLSTVSDVFGYELPRAADIDPLVLEAARVLQDMVDYSRGTKLGWDLHGGNARMRGNAIVLIDPLYDPKSFNDACAGSDGRAV